MYLSIDNLHEIFEFSKTVKKHKLNFNEFAMLYRLYEGVKQSDLPESLYISQPTLSRCKAKLIKKYHVKTFSQLLLKLDALNLFDTPQKIKINE